MPIVIIRSLRGPTTEDPNRLLSAVSARVAEALGTELGDVWTYWQEVRAVMMGTRAASSFEGHAPVVSILARRGRSEDQIAAALSATARAVSAALGVPLDDVWVHWVDVAPGRIFAGGRLL